MKYWTLSIKRIWQGVKNKQLRRNDGIRCEVCGPVLFASIASLLVIEAIVLVPSYQSHLASLHEKVQQQGEALLQQIDLGLQFSNHNAFESKLFEKILQAPGVTSLAFHDQAGITLKQLGSPVVDVTELLAKASTCCDLDSYSVLDIDGQKVLAARSVVNGLPITSTLQIESHQIQQQARAYILNTLLLIGIICAAVLGSIVAVLSRHTGKLHFAAYHDAQTGLFNSKRLRQYLEDEIPAHTGYTIIAFDLDGYSTTQLRWGEKHATELIKHVGREVIKVLDETHVLFRLRQDQFAVLVRHHTTNKNKVTEFVDKIRGALQVPVQLESEHVTLTACYGIYHKEDSSQVELSSAEILDRLILSLESAKAQGNDQLREFGTDLQKVRDYRISVITRLRSALAEDQLSLHYQPQYHAADRSIAGAESLMRWNHPSMGAISPAEFIPLAEQTGIIVDYGAWAMRTAVEQYTLWRSQGINPPGISVNLSPRQFIDENLVQTVTDIMDHYNIEPGELELEITESAVIGSPTIARQKMLQLHSLGVVFAIDDFGTGHSSMSNLGSFPFSRLKVDQSFVRELHENKNSRVIVRACIDLAHKLGMDVVAEGVETKDGFELLRDWNCDIIQGYYFSKPLSSDDTQHLLMQQLPPQSGYLKVAQR